MSFSKALALGILFIITTSIAEERKTITAARTSGAPVIDGRIEEAVWSNVEPATGFHRFDPEGG